MNTDRRGEFAQLSIPFEGFLSKKQALSSAIRTGMRKAAERGVHIGRPKQPLEELGRRSSTIEVRKLLARGKSVRQIAKKAGVSVTTVLKIKDLVQPTIF